MSLEWIHENPPRWDRQKAAIVGGSPRGIFELGDYAEGDLIPGEWWRVEEDGSVLGYGWMDSTWGDAEILLVVRADRQKQGVGTFVLDHLEKEALARGLNYLYNVVRPTHPDGEAVTGWLKSRKFEESSDGLLKRRVSSTSSRA
jgi:GNAT superfamily N-acetyltransferase